MPHKPDFPYSVLAETVQSLANPECIRATHPRPRPPEIEMKLTHLAAVVAHLRVLAREEKAKP